MLSGKAFFTNGSSAEANENAIENHPLGDGQAKDRYTLSLVSRRRLHAAIALSGDPPALGSGAGHCRSRARDGRVSLSLPLLRRQARLHTGLPGRGSRT